MIRSKYCFVIFYRVYINFTRPPPTRRSCLSSSKKGQKLSRLESLKSFCLVVFFDKMSAFRTVISAINCRDYDASRLPKFTFIWWKNPRHQLVLPRNVTCLFLPQSSWAHQPYPFASRGLSRLSFTPDFLANGPRSRFPPCNMERPSCLPDFMFPFVFLSRRPHLFPPGVANLFVPKL